MACVSTLVHLLDKNKRYDIFVEIGGMYGASAKLLLSQFKIEKYYIIDPYVIYDDYEHDGFCKILNEKSGDGVFETIKNELKDYPVEFIRDFSNNVAHLFKDESIDFCFIDGNHSYKYVYEDIKNFYPKVKMGGILSGDDYFMRNKTNGGGGNQDMVYEAVHAYFDDGIVVPYGNHGKYPKSWAVKKIN